MSAETAEKKVAAEEKAGELLFCGGTCWDIIGRKRSSGDTNLVSPTRLRPLVGVDIRFVASGCCKFHYLVTKLFSRISFHIKYRRSVIFKMASLD